MLLISCEVFYHFVFYFGPLKSCFASVLFGYIEFSAEKMIYYCDGYEMSSVDQQICPVSPNPRTNGKVSCRRRRLDCVEV